MTLHPPTASIVLAAGRGSRMKGFNGNKTLLPLIPQSSCFKGSLPIIHHILSNLPPGPMALVIHHRKEDMIAATRHLELTYCEQPELNGTGGALFAAQPFLENEDFSCAIITMGDVPFVKKGTYMKLLEGLDDKEMMVLAFRPESKKQYGVLEMEGARVRSVIEWKYWSTFSEETQGSFPLCNAGIYAVKKQTLLHYLPVLQSRPHLVRKQIHGIMREQKEYFITDLIESMHGDGLAVGYTLAEDEREVMGIDDVTALTKAQEIFRRHKTTCSRYER